MKTQTIDRHCAVRAREGWVKKLCSLVITIRILGVILSDIYLLEIANQCQINKKVLSSKTSLLVKNQTLNKALLQKIHRSTKNIHTSFFMQPHITLRIRCTKINVLWNFTSITMTLFSITLKLVSFLVLISPYFHLISILITFNRTFLLTGHHLWPGRGGGGEEFLYCLHKIHLISPLRLCKILTIPPSSHWQLTGGGFSIIPPFHTLSATTDSPSVPPWKPCDLPP